MQNIIKFIIDNLNSNYIYNENDIEKLDKDSYVQIKHILNFKHATYPLTSIIYDINNRLFIYEWIDTIDEIEYSLYIELDNDLFKRYLNKEIQEYHLFDNPVSGIYYLELASLHGKEGEVYEQYKIKNLSIIDYSKNIDGWCDFGDIYTTLYNARVEDFYTL